MEQLQAAISNEFEEDTFTNSEINQILQDLQRQEYVKLTNNEIHLA